MSSLKGVFKKKSLTPAQETEEVKVVQTKNPDGSITTTTTRIIKGGSGKKDGGRLIDNSSSPTPTITTTGKSYLSTISTTIIKGGETDEYRKSVLNSSDKKPAGWFNSSNVPKKPTSPEKKGILPGLGSRYTPGNADPITKADVVEGGKKLFGAATGKSKFMEIKKGKVRKIKT